MLLTLKCIFEGRRELFKGLKIEKMRWDWAKTYPVVMLNMADVTASKVAAEEGSAFGYADAIIETKKFVWVFEFKFNKSTSRSDAKHPFPRNSVPFAPASPGRIVQFRRIENVGCFYCRIVVVGLAALAYQLVEEYNSPWLVVFPGVATGACRRGD